MNMKKIKYHGHHGLPTCILTLIMGAKVDVVPRVCELIVSSDT